jgi:carboxymethylenebutenolidase
MTDMLKDNGGKDLGGYLSLGDGKPGKPSVVVIHEWWGLNDQIRGVADRFAKEGFTAFASDLYRGKLATDAETAKQYSNALDWKQAVDDVRHAVQALSARDPKTRVGVVGFCMGGAVALASAAGIPELAACVAFYGIPDSSKADLTRIKGKVLGHFAKDDGWVTPAKADALVKSLKKAKVPVEAHSYDASHGFFNETREGVYSAENAKLAWERTVAFFKATLK